MVRLLLKWLALLVSFYLVFLVAQTALHKRTASSTSSAMVHGEVLIDRDVRRNSEEAGKIF